MSNGNFNTSGTLPSLPQLLNPNAGLQGQAQAPFDNPLLDTRPPKARLINSASGGLSLDGTWQGKQYTTDIFATNTKPPLNIFVDNPPVPRPNPFIGNPQAARVRAFCVVVVAGVDITDRIMPYLISLRIIHRPLLTAEIEIDDRFGRLPLPPAGAGITIYLGWRGEQGGLLFSGNVWEVEYADARQGGRHMTVHALGINITNNIKEPGSDNLGEGAPPGANEGTPHGMDEFIRQGAQLAGVTIDYMSPTVGTFQRDHWDRQNESFMQMVTRLCDSHGLFPLWHDGNQLSIMAFTDSPVTVIAQNGNNLISLRVRPFVSRGVYNADEQHYFDTQAGQWKRIKVGNNYDPQVDAVTGAIANALHPSPAASRMDAMDDASGGAAVAGTDTGHGRICINGEPSARFMCHVQVIGVRPSVDGDYIAADAVEHIYSRQGYITWLDVRTNPYAGASSNVLQGYFAEQIALLPPTPYGPSNISPPVVRTPPLELPGLLDPGINPSTSVNSITSLPPEAPPPFELDPFGPGGGFPIAVTGGFL
jgi:phage protein D